MSPKTTQKLINLDGHAEGIAGHYHWEKEVLIDYIASRFAILREDIEEDAKKFGVSHETSYLEMIEIAAALRLHPSAGMAAKISLTKTFFDLRDFVEWTKEELADYLIHQIVKCDLGSVFSSMQGQHRTAAEISGLAFAIYFQQNEDACVKAEEEAVRCRNFRAAEQEAHARAAHAAVVASSPSQLSPAPAKPRKSTAN